MDPINLDNIANSISQGFINQLGIDNTISDVVSLLVVGIPTHIINQALNRAVQATVKPVIRMMLTNVSIFIPTPLLLYSATSKS